MTHEIDILRDAFERIRDTVSSTVAGLSDDDLTFRPGGTGNSIAWLVWHLARVQDSHIADAGGTDQLWTSAGWADRFGLALPSSATGYGMTSDEVGLVRGVTAEQLTDYLTAVHDRTAEYLTTLDDGDLERIVDTRWDPPVTLAARLVSVISDDLQHAGQAGYVAGLLKNRA
jgi:uncharacterized damage-inducible protein DinB